MFVGMNIEHPYSMNMHAGMNIDSEQVCWSALRTDFNVYYLYSWVRFWTAKSSKKSAFFRTKKSAFAKKSALKSAIFSAKISALLQKVLNLVLFKVLKIGVS